MFKQESYDDFNQAEPQDGGLFHNYEIKTWDRTTPVFQFLTISLLLNVFVLVFIAQTNLLTARGCDSPFVGRVCQVLDMAYVGTVLFGTEREYVDMAYEKTDLGDAEITFIDVSGETPPLSYPPGYFQIANPVQYAMLQQQQQSVNPVTTTSGMPFPGFQMSTPSDSESALLKLRPQAPPSNPNPLEDDTSAPPFNPTYGANSGIRKRGRGGRVPNSTKQAPADILSEGDPTASSTPKVEGEPANPLPAADEAKEDQFGVFINKRPLKDYAKTALEKIDNKTVSLDKSVKVVISGTLGTGKDGKTIVLKDPKPVRASTDPVNDPAMEKFVQDAILAVGDAGWFGYLDKFKVKNVLITVEQTETTVLVSLRSDQPSENIAKSTASAFNSVIQLGSAAAKGDELAFLKLARTTNEGKAFVLNFEIPKPLVTEMVLRKLAETKEKENKPNSTALVPTKNNAAEK